MRCVFSLCVDYFIVVVGIGDDTLKLWDFRNFQKPLGVAENLSNLFPMYSNNFIVCIVGVLINIRE